MVNLCLLWLVGGGISLVLWYGMCLWQDGRVVWTTWARLLLLAALTAGPLGSVLLAVFLWRMRCYSKRLQQAV